jgi:acetyl-CoA carboxylase biotin carboxyl carrier protein
MNSKNNKDRLVDEEVIRGLAELLNDTGLSEIEIEQHGLRIRIARNLTVTAAVAAPAAIAAASASAPAAAPILAHDENHPGTVKSPMVGTVYRAAEPGAANFVEVGATVKQGETVLIIEAMKTMNHIPAPRAGTVKAILVANEQPVEYGEALMIIE